MKPYAECGPCIVKWTYERTSSSASEEQRFSLMRAIMGALSNEFTRTGNLGLICKKVLEAVSGSVLSAAARYNRIKKETNHVVQEILPKAREFIKGGETPRQRFERACFLASAGNVSPIGAPDGAFEFSEVENILAGKGPQPVMIGNIYEAARKGAHVLFFCDNAGEIGLDSLLVEELKRIGLSVTLVVKEAPFFEDATVEDARFFSLDGLVDQILTVNSVFIPGETMSAVEETSRQADLVIAKGVFNFEALYGEAFGKSAIYMLKMKCGPLSEQNRVNVGDFVIRLEKR